MNYIFEFLLFMIKVKEQNKTDAFVSFYMFYKTDDS